MNIQKFNQLIDHIKSLPLPDPGIDATRGNSNIMEGFTIDFDIEFGDSVCGTVGCIAGEACMMEYPRLKHLEFNGFKAPNVSEVMHLLEIENSGLFYLNEWPRDLKDRYSKATDTNDLRKSVLAQRKVMIQAIRRYMKDPDEFGTHNNA